MRSAPTSRIAPAGAALLALLLLGSAALRLWGLRQDPAATDEARMLHHSAMLWGSSRDAGHAGERLPREPSLALALHGAAQAVYFAAGSIAGEIHGTADLRRRLEVPAQDLLIAGRLVSLLLGVLSVGLVFAIGRRVAGTAAGWIAAALTAVNPACVTASQRATGDAAFLAVTLAALWSLDALAERPSRRRALVAGLLIGLAGSTRYAGFLLLLPLGAIAVARRREGVRAEHAGVAVLAASLAFVLTSPLVVVEPGAAAEAARAQVYRLRAGALGGASAGPAAIAYARALAGAAFGIPALLLAAAGIAVLARSPAKRFLPPALFALAYASAIGVWRFADARFLLPLVAILAVAAGAAAARAAWSKAGVQRAVVPALLLAVAAAPSARELARRGQARVAGDTRRIALEWIQTSLPSGASLALEHYGPPVAGAERVVYWIPFHSVTPHVFDHAYHLDWYRGFDYIVVNEMMESRYAASPRAFEAQTGFYLALAREGEMVKSFESSGGTGPAIAVYRLRSRELPAARLDSLLAAAPRTPEMSDFLNGLGAAYSRLANAAAAAAMQRKALEISPDDMRVYGNLGTTYIAAGRPDEALEVLKEGVKRFPDAAELRYTLGNAYQARRIIERAIIEYQQAIRLKPGFADAHLNLGRSFADAGRYPDAAAALETYLRLAPDAPRREDVLEAIRYLRTHQAPVHPAGRG